MIDNTYMLQQLFSLEAIEMVNSPFLSMIPGPMPLDWEFERVEGMLLGLAVGDALGATSEAALPEVRRERFGEIRDYTPNRFANYREVGVCTDDTQMVFWMLENLLSDGGLVPDHVAEEFTRHEI